MSVNVNTGQSSRYLRIGRKAYGEISVMSVLEPEPAVVGFLSVVSTIVNEDQHSFNVEAMVKDALIVQPSPLKPHAPNGKC